MRLSGIRVLPMQSVFIRLWSVRRTFRVTHVRMPVRKDVFPSAITLHRCRLLCRVPNVFGGGMCVASCSGQAIFLVDEETEPGFGTVTLPYEFFRCRRQARKELRSDETDRKCATAKWYPAKLPKHLTTPIC